MKENPTLLSEVTVQSYALDAKVSNDTTEYNLEKLLNGSEENLGDVLKKLPGIQIDPNGKIKANGKKIDKLLIDGKDFFGDQHQLATKNISSEMVDGISKFENFRDDYELSDSQPTQKTAINVEINEKFREKLKGNISIEGGFNERYSFESNFFTFSEKINVFCIANANNLGNQVFSIEDYIGFRGLSSFIKQNTLNQSVQTLPSFLFPQNNYKEKNERLIALNVSYVPSKKLKVNTHTIFDEVNSVHQAIINQHFFSNQRNNILKTKDNSFFLNNSFLELAYKINEKSVLNVTSSISFDKHKGVKDDNFNDVNFLENTTTKTLVFSQNLEYSRFLGENTKFTSSLFNTNNSDDYRLEIKSDQAFLDLFTDAPYNLLQDEIQTKNTTVLYSGISTKLFKSKHLKLHHLINLSSDEFLSSISSNNFTNDISIKHFENQLEVGLFNKEKSKFKYDVGFKFNLVERNQNSALTNVLPYSTLLYNFSNSIRLSLLYHQSRVYPEAQHLITAPLVSIYDYILSGSTIGLNDISKNENLQFSCFFNDFFSNIYFNLDAEYSRQKNVYSSDNSYFTNYTLSEHIVLSKKSHFRTHFFLEKKFDGLPLLFKTKNSYRHNDDVGLLNGERQPILTTSIYTDLVISSNFMSPIFNFELGYSFRKSESYNSSTSFTSSLEKSTAFIQFFINHSNVSLNINNSFSSYSLLGSETVTDFRLNPSFKYHKPKSKWSFKATASDILNTSQNEIIDNEVYLTHTEDKTTSVMPGYLVVGFEYKF